MFAQVDLAAIAGPPECPGVDATRRCDSDRSGEPFRVPLSGRPGGPDQRPARPVAGVAGTSDAGAAYRPAEWGHPVLPPEAADETRSTATRHRPPATVEPAPGRPAATGVW
ncbi:hypothetical protein GCM10020218_045150 [Dactylosporangium vinaceum]